MTDDTMRIGFIPLIDAAALIIAVDKRFAADEGLAIELTREVSWSNVRDKLNIGVFDAAHLLAPLAIASSLGIGHVKVPLVAPFMLGLNGNAITVSPGLYDELAAAANGKLDDPEVSAQALGRVVAERRGRGAEPLTFGMTFPFSTHNYQVRFWMAAGGVDPDEDVRLVVLPPPYMVDSLASHQVDGFCVGAPWNSVAVKLGIGRIIHFGCDIVARAPEKVLAVRAAWAVNRAGVLERLLRALGRAVDFINDPAREDEVVALLAAPNRVDVAAGDHSPNTQRPDADGARRQFAHLRRLYLDWPRWRGAPRAGASSLALCANGAVEPGRFGAGSARRRQGMLPPRPLRRGAGTRSGRKVAA